MTDHSKEKVINGACFYQNANLSVHKNFCRRLSCLLSEWHDLTSMYIGKNFMKLELDIWRCRGMQVSQKFCSRTGLRNLQGDRTGQNFRPLGGSFLWAVFLVIEDADIFGLLFLQGESS
jgi:hypothetical protein